MLTVKIHELKIAPEYFQAVMEHRKRFEVRKNDRDFLEGDWVLLKEWKDGDFTGREELRTITYILSDPEYVKDGFVILSI